MRRPLSLALSAALVCAQGPAATSAFAQTVRAPAAGAPVVPTVVAPVTGMSAAPAALPSSAPSLTLRTTLALAPVVRGLSPDAVQSAAGRLTAASGRTVAASALAGALAEPEGTGGSKPETVAGALQQAERGVRPGQDRQSNLHRFWTASVKPAAEPSDEVSAPETRPRPSGLEPASPKKKTSPVARAAMLGAAVTAPLLAAPWYKDAYQNVGRLIEKAVEVPGVSEAAPWVFAGLVVLLGKPLARLARKAVDKLGDRLGWEPGTKLVARHAAGWATWIAAGIASSQIIGVDPTTLAQTFGVTTLAMSLALKGFLGNLIQGGALLLSHPFDIGDKIRLGKHQYDVVSMNLREVILTKDGGATHSHFAYSVLADLPITILKKYVAGKSFVSLQAPDLKPPQLPSLPWVRVAGLVAGAGVAVPAALLAHSLLVSSLPILYAVGIGIGTFFLARWVPRLVERWAKARKWGANETMITRMSATAATYLIGLASALRVLGVSWQALAASAGVTGIVVTIAATEVIQSTIAAFTLLSTQPFTLGDRIKIGDDIEGTVVDITLRYVVIKRDEPGDVYSLIPVGKFTQFEAPGEAPSAPNPR
ncbi:MAG: mechanosensitive ion channel [Elusimicrobia bacterium]|nr:mechanosensitive ion channel [Elusimicrobiota bacterium]